MNCILCSQHGLHEPKGVLVSCISSTYSVVLQVLVGWKDALAEESVAEARILADISNYTSIALLRY